MKGIAPNYHVSKAGIIMLTKASFNWGEEVIEVIEFRIKVIEVKGRCDNGHRVGEEFKVRDAKTPSGICLSSFSAILPKLMALMLGGDIPWSEDKNRDIIACPDPKNAVIWEVSRIET